MKAKAALAWRIDEQRRHTEAARFFREALTLRRALGAEALMEATADALRLTAAARAPGRGASRIR